ncbi:RNA polymerase sigma factor [Candidatus Peribacteria bacterium]|nr:RNA polymerase sigma factor [Candidatus Peribacteria bacterium]
MTSSDQDMVREALANAEAFATIIDTYEGRLRSYIYRLGLTDDPSVDDTLQEVFLSAWRNLHGYDPAYRLSTWLYRITRNAVYSYYRRVSTRPRMTVLDTDTLQIADPADTPHEGVLRTENSTEVRAVLALLKPEYQEVLLLYYLEDIPYDEIADVLQLPMGTVSTRLRRAKEAFAAHYEMLYSPHA